MTTPSPNLRERLINLDTAYNIRHIGGYPTRDGHTTGSHVVRAASLGRLSHDGLTTLAHMGIRTVVDFRSSSERDRDKTPALEPHGIDHIIAPVFERDAEASGVPENFAGFKAMYREFLDDGGSAYRMFAESLANSRGGFLYHCAVGKDRTGVATMLLLELAGVPDDQILDDYSHSAGLLAPVFDRWDAWMRDKNEDPARMAQHKTSNPEDMASTLAHLRGRWGSAEAYFAWLGCNDETIHTVRSRVLLTPPEHVNAR